MNGEKVIGIKEKPKVPKTNFAVTGLYIHDCDGFDAIKTLKSSGRGELEITDINNYDVNKRVMEYGCLKDSGVMRGLLKVC